MGRMIWSPLDSYFKAFEYANEYWKKTLEEFRLKTEAELQLELLESATKEIGTSDLRLYSRLDHISPAARAFFVQHRPLIMQCWNPFVRRTVSHMLRNFVRSYQRVEHQVKKDLHVPLSEWKAPQSHRDKLAKLVSADPVVCQMVAHHESLPPRARERVQQQLCGQLAAECESHHSQQQMG